MPRKGHGVDAHCHDFGLEDPSTTAQDAFKDDKDIGTERCEGNKDAAIELKEPPTTYEEWIVAE